MSWHKQHLRSLIGSFLLLILFTTVSHATSLDLQQSQPKEVNCGGAMGDPEPSSSGLTELSPYHRYLQRIRRYSRRPESEVAREHLPDFKPVGTVARLILENLFIVPAIVRQYRSASNFQVDDLIQAGNLGLLKAALRFDESHANTFSTYAAHWVRAEIKDVIKNNKSLVRLGTTRAERKIFWNLPKLTARFSKNGEEVNLSQIAELLNVSLDVLVEMVGRLQPGHEVSFSPVDSEDEAPAGLENTLAVGTPSVDVLFDQKRGLLELNELIAQFGGALTNPKEIDLYYLRLLSDDPLTLEELGKKHGVSRARMNQLENRLRARLSNHLAEFHQMYEGIL